MNLLLKAHNTRSSSPNQKVMCHLCPAHVCSLKHDSNHVALACFPQDEPFSCLSSMIEAIAASGSPVKSQQLGEPDLTLEEKKKVSMDQYKSKALVFLEHYQSTRRLSHTWAVTSECSITARRFRDGHPAQLTGKGSVTIVIAALRVVFFFLKHQIEFFQIRLLPLKLTLVTYRLPCTSITHTVGH